ncbi:hypothetical protein Droror1_Dr00012573 [Drosera rotundifolia]
MEKEMEKSASGEKYQQPARPAIISNGAQIFLRVLVVVCSASAAYLMFTSKEEKLVYGFPMSAKWSDSPSTVYGAYVDVVVGASALVSLFITLITLRQRGHTIYFVLFLHDLMMMSLQLGGCVAATSIGYVAKHGFEKAGWIPICDNFCSFCTRAKTSVTIAFGSTVMLFVLCIIFAINSRHMHVHVISTANV